MINNYPLFSHTTFRIGGPAKYFAVCNKTDEIQDTLAWCSQRAIPWIILGNGSNVLVHDDGYPGLVIKLGHNLKGAYFSGDTVDVGGGCLLPTLSRYLLARGWGGFEFMCAIPGTIGGAVRMNAGTKHGEIKDHFISSTLLSADGKLRVTKKEDMEFSYRTSCIAKTKDIVLSARFKLPYPDKPWRIRKKIKEIKESRHRKQPKIKRNCGSVFKTPLTGKPAGWYIDRAGLKGLKIGGAMVAYEHANWIVNLGNARAEHVKALISNIQEEVFKRYSVYLEKEVIFIPEDL